MSPLTVETVRATVRTYARPIASLAVATGIVCAGVSVIGFFDNRIQYCDGRSNPCTWVVVPESYQLPDEAKFIKSVDGNALTRTATSLSGVILFSIAIASIASWVETQEEIEQQLEEQQSREQQLNDIEAEIESGNRYKTLRHINTSGILTKWKPLPSLHSCLLYTLARFVAFSIAPTTALHRYTLNRKNLTRRLLQNL